MGILRTVWRSRLRRVAPCLWALGFGALPVAHAVEPAQSALAAPSAEYQIKAVFLFNFAQFIEWPPGTFCNASAPIVIGVLGSDPFGSYLDKLVEGERIGDHPVVVRRYGRVEDIADCGILFISRSETAGLDAIMARLNGRRLLTVGDVDVFNLSGGMVRFSTEHGKIRLRINIAAARAADLRISSRLLAHATIVSVGKGAP